MVHHVDHVVDVSEDVSLAHYQLHFVARSLYAYIAKTVTICV